MFKKFTLMIMMASLLTGCIHIYKKDIKQGNLLTQAQVDQLKPGYSKLKVQSILGTPSHISAIDITEWHYPYHFKSGRTGEITHVPLTLVFKGDSLKCYKGTLEPSGLKACQDS